MMGMQVDYNDNDDGFDQFHSTYHPPYREYYDYPVDHGRKNVAVWIQTGIVAALVVIVIVFYGTFTTRIELAQRASFLYVNQSLIMYIHFSYLFTYRIYSQCFAGSLG
jgi:hypothetical protein